MNVFFRARDDTRKIRLFCYRTHTLSFGPVSHHRVTHQPAVPSFKLSQRLRIEHLSNRSALSAEIGKTRIACTRIYFTNSVSLMNNDGPLSAPAAQPLISRLGGRARVSLPEISNNYAA